MRHTSSASIHFFALSAAIAFTLPLHAASDIRVAWDQVCRAADNNRLTILTVDGKTVEGFCMSITVDEMSISTGNGRIAKIARSSLARIDMQRSRNNGRQLRELGKQMGGGLRTSVGWLLSPWAPLGLVAVPVIIGWGAAAAPFCAIGDVIHQGDGTQQIKVN